MPLPAEKQDWRLMQRMFWTIAPRYDFVTRVFSLGMDRGWKARGAREAALPAGAVVLDLACGTGDFAQLVERHCPGTRVVGLDLTPGMLHRARQRGVHGLVCGDVLALPFADRAFDAVFVGYGMRNFPDLSSALREIGRVTRPGGLLVSLDFFLPSSPVARALFLRWLYVHGAFWGLLLHGLPRVYTYIPDSLRGFVSIEEFSRILQSRGFTPVTAKRFILGGIGLHRAVKSS